MLEAHGSRHLEDPRFHWRVEGLVWSAKELERRLFHHSFQSSFAKPVNEMWKLCNTGTKSHLEPGFTIWSEEFGTDF